MSRAVDKPVRSALETLLRQFPNGPDTVLFTTFNFSSSFFEANVLPLLVGNSADELKGAASNPATLNAALEQIKTLVVCDRSTRPEPKGNLRYGLLPVGLRKGRFHPKMILMTGVLASGERGFWLAVGSGNLSLSGWALNREVVGVTPVGVQQRDELLPMLEWLQLKAQDHVDWAEGAAGTEVERSVWQAEEGDVRQVLAVLIESLRAGPLAEDPASSLPSLHLALPPELLAPGAAHRMPLLGALRGQQDWTRATVVSPYWGEVERLEAELAVSDCRFVPSLRPDGKYGFPLETVPAGSRSAGRFWRFRKESERYTHAKAMLLENDSEKVLCAGSANFTAAALHPAPDAFANVEAMLRYRVSEDLWAGMFDALDQDEIAAPDEDAQDEGAPPLPPFDADVVCDWKKKAFFVRLRVHPGRRVSEVRLQLAEDSVALSVGPEVLHTLPFRGRFPVRSFQVDFTLNDERCHYRGLVNQLNAYDDELGYHARPRLSSVLELLRSLDPKEPDETIRRRGELRREPGGEDDEDEAGASFDFFGFFQATYKLRQFYAQRPELDPFQPSAQGVPGLLRAILGEEADTPAAEIARYVYLAELAEIVRWLRQRRGADDGVQIAEEIAEGLRLLEPKITESLQNSESFRSMFAEDHGSKAAAFLAWFRSEIEKDLSDASA